MSFEAKILADSLNPCGDRLVTFELTYPRFIHSEILTHRMFSRNSASSRAIPVEKMIAKITMNPVIPIHWGKNQRGMQADEEIPISIQHEADATWLEARDSAIKKARALMDLGIHKQIANRLVEPFMWMTTILSTTSFRHFRLLRVHPAAEPHFQKIAGMAAILYDNHIPKQLHAGEWHLPLFGFPGDEDVPEQDRKKIATARCARVSYLTHDGKRDLSADLSLHDSLSTNGHWSPFEHCAQALNTSKWCGNFLGWRQYRKDFHNEFVQD